MAFDVIIIGAGAAGLFCAIEAGKRGCKVLVIEHAERVGKKIAISGGGRCNFTNLHTRPESFLSANPHFCKSALARYTPVDFISLVDRHGIDYHEKKLGQLFCDGSSQQIIDLLLNECSDAGVEIRCDCTVSKISKLAEFEVETNQGLFAAPSLVIATGGLSINLSEQLTLVTKSRSKVRTDIEQPRPGLVPFTLDPIVLERLAKLSGVSIDALVRRYGHASFRENVLIASRVSGPLSSDFILLGTRSSYFNRSPA